MKQTRAKMPKQIEIKTPIAITGLKVIEPRFEKPKVKKTRVKRLGTRGLEK